MNTHYIFTKSSVIWWEHLLSLEFFQKSSLYTLQYFERDLGSAEFSCSHLNVHFYYIWLSCWLLLTLTKRSSTFRSVVPEIFLTVQNRYFLFQYITVKFLYIKFAYHRYRKNFAMSDEVDIFRNIKTACWTAFQLFHICNKKPSITSLSFYLMFSVSYSLFHYKFIALQWRHGMPKHPDHRHMLFFLNSVCICVPISSKLIEILWE